MSTAKKIIICLIVAVLIPLINTATIAGEVGRYQAVVFPPHSKTNDRPVLIIIDTKDGHIWEKLLVEKPWYAGRVELPASVEKGFIQEIIEYLFPKRKTQESAKPKTWEEFKQQHPELGGK
jgi:hypothetical protein